MSRTPAARAVAVALVALLAAACGHTHHESPGAVGSATSADGFARGAEGGNPYFDQADYDRQLAQRSKTPEGDPATPWLQAIDPMYVDTAKYAKSGDWHMCFSNAGVGNPWRVTGFTTMKAEAKLHERIGTFTVVDAESKDDKQIADIADLLTKRCDALIISPNTAAALTPAVEKACASGVPVVVFDRGVETDCPVTFVHPIGGYAFGATAAEFLRDHMSPGGKVLALRILPGVDVLENRWAAAKVIFDQAEATVVGVEFTDGTRRRPRTPTPTFRRSRARTSRTSSSSAGEEADRDRPDVPGLHVAYGADRGHGDPEWTQGAEGLGTAAADRHVRQPRHVRPPRQVIRAIVIHDPHPGREHLGAPLDRLTGSLERGAPGVGVFRRAHAHPPC